MAKIETTAWRGSLPEDATTLSTERLRGRVFVIVGVMVVATCLSPLWTWASTGGDASDLLAVVASSIRSIVSSSGWTLLAVAAALLALPLAALAITQGPMSSAASRIRNEDLLRVAGHATTISGSVATATALMAGLAALSTILPIGRSELAATAEDIAAVTADLLVFFGGVAVLPIAFGMQRALDAAAQTDDEVQATWLREREAIAARSRQQEERTAVFLERTSNTRPRRRALLRSSVVSTLTALIAGGLMAPFGAHWGYVLVMLGAGAAQALLAAAAACMVWRRYFSAPTQAVFGSPPQVKVETGWHHFWLVLLAVAGAAVALLLPGSFALILARQGFAREVVIVALLAGVAIAVAEAIPTSSSWQMISAHSINRMARQQITHEQRRIDEVFAR